MYPPISCVCITFGRPTRLLNEAIYSFLIQNYPGEKELLILNDFDQQTLRFDHPEVSVINVRSRFRTVGEKRNAAVAMCRHDLVAVWDDDDIFLPHRLSLSITMYDDSTRFFKPSRALILNDGLISGPETNLFHSGSLWHRSLFDEVGGYPHLGSGQDMDLELRFEAVIGPHKNYDGIEARDIFYLYRWSGTHSYHLSAFGRDGSDKPGSAKVRDYVLRQLKEGTIESGEIVLQPTWRVNYSELAKDYIGRRP